ncbi:hypothetical protein C8R45DRAFT_407864 [Mycena sanguinolenta]|nr:hypothetical protein C8R45DRAFT_407864 [Mycena sanguinolenta]
MTPSYLNALFVLFVARFTLAARPNDRRQEAPTSECTGSTTVYSTATSTTTTTSTSTDWVTITLTSTVYSTVTATATDTFTSTATDTITSTATDTITLTSTDTVTVTESGSTTISATSTTPTDTETPTAPPTSTTTSTSTPPSTTSTCDTATATPVTSWTYLGCYTDSISSRTLSAVQKGDIANNSVASCQATCLAAGYDLAGVEFSNQCFCDSSIRAGVKLGGTCNTACSGGVGTCGGTDAIDIYKAVTASCVTPWKFRGCFTDSATRTLSAVQMGDVANNSVASCQATCLAAGYPFAGVEDSQQCFCDSSILASAKAASLANCQDACTSGVGTCGGTWFISIYEAV